MNEVLVNDVGAIDLGVNLGHFFQRVTAGLGEERHEAQLHTMFLLEKLLVFFAQRHDLSHVDLVIRGQHRGSVLAVLQTLRNRLAQAGHLHPLFARLVIGRNRSARNRGSGDGGCDDGRRGDHGFQRVFLHHPSIATRALNLAWVNALLGQDFLGAGRVLDVFTSAGGSGRGFCVRCRCRGGSGGAGPTDHRKLGGGVHGAAFGGEDFC